MVLYMEHLSVQRHNDAAFEAKLHGFKMNETATMKTQSWSDEDDRKMQELARKRFEEMQGVI
jgi:hypothetical protein